MQAKATTKLLGGIAEPTNGHHSHQNEYHFDNPLQATYLKALEKFEEERAQDDNDQSAGHPVAKATARS